MLNSVHFSRDGDSSFNLLKPTVAIRVQL